MAQVAQLSVDQGRRKYESMTAVVWHRFRKHPGAIAGAFLLVIIMVSTLLVPLSPYDPEASDLSSKLQAPSWQHPFGTDALGRDMTTRILYGGRISLLVGLMVVTITLSIGVPIGAIAGYFGGWIDNVLMRIIDATLALPSLLVLILLGAILRETRVPFFEKNTVITIAVALGLLSWMTVARLVRAIFLTFRDMEYVQAARALGASSWNRHWGSAGPLWRNRACHSSVLESGRPRPAGEISWEMPRST
jgi:peptide/nickel transport system permease protein